jgi:hypothetical protein
MKYIGLMLVGISIISYCAQPPMRLRYSFEECVQLSPPGTPIPNAISFPSEKSVAKEVILEKIKHERARSASALSSSLDVSDEVAQAMYAFCKNHPTDATKILAEVKNVQLSKSSSALGKTSDEPS